MILTFPKTQGINMLTAVQNEIIVQQKDELILKLFDQIGSIQMELDRLDDELAEEKKKVLLEQTLKIYFRKKLEEVANPEYPIIFK